MVRYRLKPKCAAHTSNQCEQVGQHCFWSCDQQFIEVFVEIDLHTCLASSSWNQEKNISCCWSEGVPQVFLRNISSKFCLRGEFQTHGGNGCEHVTRSSEFTKLLPGFNFSFLNVHFALYCNESTTYVNTISFESIWNEQINTERSALFRELYTCLCSQLCRAVHDTNLLKSRSQCFSLKIQATLSILCFKLRKSCGKWYML